MYAEVVRVTPIRCLGKTSLSDEIKMLEMLRDKLLSVRGQARLIADSTGDADTKTKMECVASDAQYSLDRADLCLYRAREAQAEADAEAGREVTLQKAIEFVVEPTIGPDDKLLYYDVDLHEGGSYVCGVASFWINGRTMGQAASDAEAFAALLREKEA